jgi:hypothetical protein
MRTWRLRPSLNNVDEPTTQPPLIVAERRLITTISAAENVSDLLYNHGIDVAITYSDDLDQYKKSDGVKNIDQRINHISKLYDNELHIYAPYWPPSTVSESQIRERNGQTRPWGGSAVDRT